MKILKVLSILLLMLPFSCKDRRPEKQKMAEQETIKEKDSSQFATVETIVTDTTAEAMADNIVTLNLNEVTVLFNGLEVETYDQDSIQINNNKDSALLSIAVGESYEDKNFTIRSDRLTDITVEQQYETSVTIMNEGPHCDLINWKHYFSPWTVLNADKNGTYRTATYPENEWAKFIPVTISELKEAVKQHCDEDWYRHIKNVKSVNEYPVSVSISRIFLRIAGKRKDDSRQVVKIIVALMPMGC